jgi:hypothetical protein
VFFFPTILCHVFNKKIGKKLGFFSSVNFTTFAKVQGLKDQPNFPHQKIGKENHDVRTICWLPITQIFFQFNFQNICSKPPKLHAKDTLLTNNLQLTIYPIIIQYKASKP